MLLSDILILSPLYKSTAHPHSCCLSAMINHPFVESLMWVHSTSCFHAMLLKCFCQPKSAGSLMLTRVHGRPENSDKCIPIYVHTGRLDACLGYLGLLRIHSAAITLLQSRRDLFSLRVSAHMRAADQAAWCCGCGGSFVAMNWLNDDAVAQ